MGKRIKQVDLECPVCGDLFLAVTELAVKNAGTNVELYLLCNHCDNHFKYTLDMI